MKEKALVLSTILLFFANFFFAQEQKQAELKVSNWTFSLEGGMGLRIGTYNEIVWAKRSYDNERYKQSELEYRLRPSFYTALNFSVNYKRLGFKLSNKFFIASKTGTLTDSDWRNDSSCQNGDTTTKTDFSEHTLFLKDKFGGIAGFDLELKGDYKFYPTNWLSLAPLLSFNVQYMSFLAKDGYGYYGVHDYKNNRILPYNDIATRQTYSFEGKNVIEYEAYNFFIWTGIGAKFTPFSWLHFELASEFSPVSLLLDFDKHLTNSKDFKEIVFSTLSAFRQSVKAEFILKKNFSICQTCVFVISKESEGAMYYKKSEDSSYQRISKNSGGGKVTYFDLELSLKFSW